MGQLSKLQLYGDLMSQPTRAVLLFCRVNDIDVELHIVNVAKGDQRTPEFKAINPFGKVPCIVDGRFKLAESHAIMEYLACTHPGVVDHWYPSDAQTRANISSLLHWHHLNLRRGSMVLVFNRVLAPLLGAKGDPRAAAEGLLILKQSLEVMETVWLKEGYPFLASGRQPSIADLSVVCEIMQLQLMDKEEWEELVGSKKRITAWIEAVKKATAPHFDDVHTVLYKAAARRAGERENQSVRTATSVDGELTNIVSKL